MMLYFEETGELGAPSIVFLHGIGASGWMWWRQVAACSDFHCLTVDLPGHGKSNSIRWVSLADTADQVAEIIGTHATNGRSHVVGLSLGAYINLALMEKYSERLERVILSGVTAGPMPNRSLLKPQLWLMSKLLKKRRYAEMQMRSYHLPPVQEKEAVENMLAMSIDAYQTIWEEAVEFSVQSDLYQINIPTLITAGGTESNIILEAIEILSEILPSAEGRVAPGHGHGWNIEDPDLFNEMMRAWLCDTSLPDKLELINGKEHKK